MTTTATEIKKEILIVIENDYNGDTAERERTEDINLIVNDIDVFCEIQNTSFINIVEQEKNYAGEKEDYKNSIQIEAKGSSQSDWQTYILYYNEKELKTPQQRIYFSDLVKHLERSFTHNNNYFASSYEVVEIDGKIFKSEAEDGSCFSISHDEFPDEEEVKKTYLEIYGSKFDKIEININ
ncbi:MAG: hypothetical protein QM499_01170 [Flavobacteriaceae bacterium]